MPLKVGLLLIMHMSGPLFAKTMFPGLATGAAKHFLFPTNLATQG